MRTFCVCTLGCKVNQYESEQIAALLRSRGLRQVEDPDAADLRIVNTCSVTIQAASKSRQTVRQVTRLPVLQPGAAEQGEAAFGGVTGHVAQRVIVVGCWATSDRSQASQIPGVSAVLGHQDNMAEELVRLLVQWQAEDRVPPNESTDTRHTDNRSSPGSLEDGWIKQAGTPARSLADDNKARLGNLVNKNPASFPAGGAASLPLLEGRQSGHQRAFLKIQDGCDAHCTYCIIPRLRSQLWSKPVEEAVAEASRLVEAGHGELILTGIFLGAYGQPTALRRRQAEGAGKSLAALIEALCTRVDGLRRLRLSSLEPGDLGEELLAVLGAHPQVVPHFHLPLQSGSDHLLRRMNRQYTREDYLRMADRVRRVFDRPALTTDIIVGFPGETDALFAQTLEVVDRVGFLHIHAFPFSPRPGTAAARWSKDFVHGPVVNERIETLQQRAADYSYAFRQQFLGATAELLVERPAARDGLGVRHGRCERYFAVHFEAAEVRPGEAVQVRIDRVTPHRTVGTLMERKP